MTVYEIIITAISTAVLTLVGIGVTALTDWLKTRTRNDKLDKYKDIALDAIRTAIKDVAQTYVDALKESGDFTPERQQEAFQLALTKVKNIMGVAAYKALGEVYGDVDQWIRSNIEAAVREDKAVAA